MPDTALVLSCEHGGNRIPARWARLFASSRARALLRSHRGWDPGALALARQLARALRAPLLACTTSRLLADANRPRAHPRLFSSFTRDLPEDEKHAILGATHELHWHAVERAVRLALARHSRVLHLSIHSFTPVLNGVARNCDLGLLYDPARSSERELCERWQDALASTPSGLRVRRNHPYRGVSAALTTSLRGGLPPGRYLGVELELNQACWLRRTPVARRVLAAELAEALARTIGRELSGRNADRP
jgi:predicted N-formylglutamate amidohydrolase